MRVTDVIEVSTPKQESFAQKNPYSTCQCMGARNAIGSRLGYRPNCYDPRCSLPCLRNWARQQADRMSFFLAEMLPPESVTFRGNLTMPRNSSVQDHIKARADFLETIKPLCPSLRIHWILHIVGNEGKITEAHLDFTAYCHESDASQAITAVRESWKSSGGKRASMKALSDPDFTAWSKYSAKDTIPSDIWRHVPKHNGLRVTGGSKGFWVITQAELDKRIRLATRAAQFTAELLPEPEDHWAEFTEVSNGEVSNTVIGIMSPEAPSIDDSYQVEVSNTVIGIMSPEAPPKTAPKTPSIEQSWKGLVGDSKRIIYTEGSRSEQRIRDLRSTHPDRIRITEHKSSYTPLDDDALIRVAIMDGLREARQPIELDRLASSIGLQPSVVQGALESMPAVKRIPFDLTRDGTFRTDLVALCPIV